MDHDISFLSTLTKYCMTNAMNDVKLMPLELIWNLKLLLSEEPLLASVRKVSNNYSDIHRESGHKYQACISVQWWDGALQCVRLVKTHHLPSHATRCPPAWPRYQARRARGSPVRLSSRRKCRRILLPFPANKKVYVTRKSRLCTCLYTLGLG